MQLPQSLLDSLKHIEGFDKNAFEQVHLSGEQITSIRLNPAKPVNHFPQFQILNSLFTSHPIPWTQYGFYLDKRPSFTFDPLFHAGCYYVQEASSMFLEQPLKQLVDLSQPIKVLDLSAAPGGKSTHIQSLISKDSLLVSNEVIRSRANILKDNIIKWGCSNVMITNNDPRDFTALEGYFDVIVVDAPCSGSGLFRRDPDAIAEWSLNNVQLCSQRQQRILADVFPALKEDGILIYSTCSYSREEDEDIIDWILKELPVANCQLSIDNSWHIIESGGGYRFWPDKVKGEGFFMACFKKTRAEATANMRVKKSPEKLTAKEKEILGKWAQMEGLEFIRHDNTVYAWPGELENDLRFLLNKLRVVYSGTIIGELLREKLVPDHALAMSRLVDPNLERTELDIDNAIQYLKRKDLSVTPPNKGWQLVTYLGQLLGWINVLPNRINNYYPKELRILKDS